MVLMCSVQLLGHMIVVLEVDNVEAWWYDEENLTTMMITWR